MHPFLSDESLKAFIAELKLPEERKQEYIKLIPTLSEKGRSILFDALTKYYLLDYGEKRTLKALESFREFARDLDYDKLQKQLTKLDEAAAT